MTLQEFRVAIPGIQDEIALQKVTCYLSVVIPAKNEETRLPGTLIRLAHTLQALGVDYEVIVVNDGSVDDTAQIARVLGSRVITHPQSRGIAAAFRVGAKVANGAVVMLCPADIEDFAFLKHAIAASKAYDVVSISKRHPKSVVIGYSKWRWFLSNYYHRFVCFLFGNLECTDTHYIKLYDRFALRWLIKGCRINGPVGETEIMLRAKKVGCTFYEIPAKILHNTRGSKTSIKLVVRTVGELLRLWIQKP
jgi:glycosyltransferase involved in cell wall biosynthesis